jgi:probable HAF family extracellular repeat protein
MRRVAVGLILAAALTSSALALPTGYSFQTLDDPNAASGTVAYGINDAGQVTGWYNDGLSIVHAFVYDAGAWTTIDKNPLNSSGGDTQGFGINNSGQIVGGLFDNLNLGHNAFFDGTSWSELGDDPSGAKNSTTYTGINNSRVMSGIYSSPSGAQSFLYDGSTYKTLNNPYAFVQNTVAWGLNNADAVAGYYYGELPTPQGNFISQHGFIFDGTTFTGFDAPDAGRTEAWDINDAGLVVGTYFELIGGQQHWFLYDGTNFSNLNLPWDPSLVLITGINDAGQIVGRYGDGSGEHGFIGTPTMSVVPEPSTITLLTIALALIMWRLGIASWRRR